MLPRLWESFSEAFLKKWPISWGSVHLQPSSGGRPVRRAEPLGRSPRHCPYLSWLLLLLSPRLHLILPSDWGL